MFDKQKFTDLLTEVLENPDDDAATFKIYMALELLEALGVDKGLQKLVYHALTNHGKQIVKDVVIKQTINLVQWLNAA